LSVIYHDPEQQKILGVWGFWKMVETNYRRVRCMYGNDFSVIQLSLLGDNGGLRVATLAHIPLLSKISFTDVNFLQER
jgi:hypothetical protein